MKKSKAIKQERKDYIIMSTSREHMYLASFGSDGPVFSGSPTSFTKMEADNLLARMRGADWLRCAGDLEIFRF